MLKNYIFVLCVVLLSCERPKQELTFTPPLFKDTLELKGRIINDSFIMGMGYDIEFYKDYLMVNAFTGVSEEALHIFRISDGSHVRSILPKGRGPGEAKVVREADVNHQSGEVVFYDFMGWKLFRFNIDSVIHHENYKDYILGENYPIYMRTIYQLSDGYIATEGLRLKTGESPRFSIIKNDSVVFRYCSYPEVTTPGIPDGILFCYKNTAHSCISPDRTKLFCITSYGAILEVFNIGDNEISLDTIRGFYRPVFTIDKNKQTRSTPQTIFGFTDLYATSKYVYIRFNSRPNNLKNNEIAVFDWQGNCIRLYRVDYYLDKLCVDEKRNKIFAICQNKEFETLLVEFDLNKEI